MNKNSKFNSKNSKLRITIIASVVLFLINNILLGRFIPTMPGGSTTGITTMFVITLLGFVAKSKGYIPLLYLIYGAIGLISHLLVGDWMYLISIALVVLSAAIYDWLLNVGKYVLRVHLLAFPLFYFLSQLNSIVFFYLSNPLQFTFQFHFTSIVYALLLGYSGLLIAFVSYKYTKLNKI